MNEIFIPSYPTPPQPGKRIETPVEHEIAEIQRANRYHLPKKIIGITAATGIAGMYGIAALGGLQFGESERLQYLDNITPGQEQTLANFDPVTITHRGGNSPSNVKESLEAGVDLVDADITVVGDQVAVTHARYFSDFLAIDVERMYINVGAPSYTLLELLSALATSKQEGKTPGAILEFKRGASKSDIRKILDVTSSYDVPVSFSAQNWEELDYVEELTGRDDNLFYYTPSQEALDRLYQEQAEKGRKGVMIPPWLVEDNIRFLKENGFTVYSGSHLPEQVIKFLSLGVDGIITYNLSLVESLEEEPNRAHYRMEEFPLENGLVAVLEDKPIAKVNSLTSRS